MRPLLRNEPRNCCQKPSLSPSPTSQPSTSRLPSAVIPVTTTVAIDAGWDMLLRTLR